MMTVGEAAGRLSPAATYAIGAPKTQPVFSAVSLLEVAIKAAQNRQDFHTDPRDLRAVLLREGFEELGVTGIHACAVADLPPIHKDPFDRLLIAQATVEDITLLTADATIARYPGPIRLV